MQNDDFFLNLRALINGSIRRPLWHDAHEWAGVGEEICKWAVNSKLILSE